MLNVDIAKQRLTLLRFMADVCKKVNCLQPLIWEARSIENTQIMKRLDALLKIEEAQNSTSANNDSPKFPNYLEVKEAVIASHIGELTDREGTIVNRVRCIIKRKLSGVS